LPRDREWAFNKLEQLRVKDSGDPRSFDRGEEARNREKSFKKLPFDLFLIIITPSYENPVEILFEEDRK
jgi:hypothetical protein